MPSASIRSLVNGINPVVGASRDDLVVGDTVTLQSVNTHTTYSWTMAYKPEGSTATIPSPLAKNPGSFTVDLEGPYLIRLIADLSLPTETQQFVRLRYLTVFGDLKLVAAGESYNGAVPVPVDATTTGWANAQNYNLQTLLGFVARVSASGRVLYVDSNSGTEGYADHAVLQDAIDDAAATATSTTPWVILVRPGTYAEDVTFKPFVHVFGWPGDAAGVDDTRVVLVRGVHIVDTPNASDEVVLHALMLETTVSTTDPVLRKDGPGSLVVHRCSIEQNGISGTQGPALRARRGTTTVDASRVVANSALVDSRVAIDMPGTTGATLRLRNSVVMGPSCLALNTSGGNNVVAEVIDSQVASSGAAGVAIASDAESLLVEYSRITAVSGNAMLVHPGAGALAFDVGLTARWSYFGGPVSFDITGIVGATSLSLGSCEYTSIVLPGGAPATQEATTKATSLFYDNTSSGLAAEHVQDAIDEVYSFAAGVRTLDDAYDGGVPNSGSGRTIVADQGSVKIVDAPVPSDPPPAGSTDGMLEVLSGVKVGAIGFDEISLDANPFGFGPVVRMGQRVIPPNIPYGVGTALVTARSTGTPLFRNYNLRLHTESSNGGGAIGRLVLGGGDGLANGVSTPDGSPVYIEGGSTFAGAATAGSVFIMPGRQFAGTDGALVLARPGTATPATLTAAGAASNPIGVNGTATFATNMGAVTATFVAGDNLATVVSKLDALLGISASQSLGVITLTTDHLGPTAEVYFLQADPGVDAALGGFNGQAQVDGTYADFVRFRATAAHEVTIGQGGAVGPLVYNADTGKLTVPGLIDPTGLIFEQAAAPATGATEGALFVSDGSGGLTLGNLYFRPASSGVPIDISVGSATPTWASVLAVGNTSGGNNVILTSGDNIQGESSAGVGGTVTIRGGTDTGAGPTAGGSVNLRPGQGVGGGADGAILMRNAAGGQIVAFNVTGAEEIAIGTTMPLIYNGTTGKLTVPGLIDPTAVVFEEDAAPATGASEGAVFVSDGTGGLTLGSLYYRGPSNGVPVAVATATGPVPAAPQRFVYQEGGTASGNVYTSFAALYADLSAATGKKELVIDNSFTAVPTIPDGVYDFIDTAVTDGNLLAETASLAQLFRKMPLTFGTAVTITNAFSWHNIHIIGPVGGTSPIVYNDGAVRIVVFRNSFISRNVGPAPVLITGAGSGAFFLMSGGNGGFNNAGGEVISVTAGGAVGIQAQDLQTVSNGTLAGDVTALILGFSGTAEASVAVTPADQPNWLGTALPAGGMTLLSRSTRIRANGPFTNSSSQVLEQVLVDFDSAITAGGGATLQSAYDGAGSGAGRHINLFDATTPVEIQAGAAAPAELLNFYTVGGVLLGSIDRPVANTFRFAGADSSTGNGENVRIQGGSATAGVFNGGDIVIRPGAGFGGGTDGLIRLQDPAASNTVEVTVTGAEEITIGTTLPMIYNGTTGKLTVPGVIDPTALVLEHSTAPPTTAANETGLFVSDGLGAYGDGVVYFVPESGGAPVPLSLTPGSAYTILHRLQVDAGSTGNVQAATAFGFDTTVITNGPADGDTLILNNGFDPAETYTFRTVPTLAFEVLINASDVRITLTNLVETINRDSSEFRAVKVTDLTRLQTNAATRGHAVVIVGLSSAAAQYRIYGSFSAGANPRAKRFDTNVARYDVDENWQVLDSVDPGTKKFFGFQMDGFAVFPTGAMISTASSPTLLVRQVATPTSNVVWVSSSDRLVNKQPCRVASTGNIAGFTAAAPNVVDGVTLSPGDRVLVWQQSTPSQNGIYEVRAAGSGANGTWVRASDFRTNGVFAGTRTFIQEGTANSQTFITLTTTGTITVGSTSLTFVQEAPLVRTDATSTEIIASTAFTSGTIVWSSALNMRDFSEVSVWFNPTNLGSNTQVDIYVQWSDDGSTIPFDDDNGIQQSDFLIFQGTSGTFNPKNYIVRLTTTNSPAELVANAIKMFSFPKKGGSFRFGVMGNNASGAFSVRAQRLA